MSFSQDFIEKVFLLVITAVLSGLTIPLILKQIEIRKLLEQKKFEADLARQSKIIEAQSDLLDTLSALMWEWRYFSKEVVYYASWNQIEQFIAAKENYNKNVWNFLSKFRVATSRARRLVSENTFTELQKMYHYIVDDIDVKVNTIAAKETMDDQVVKDASDLAERFSNEVSEKIDSVLDTLAYAMELKVKSKEK
jgi:hypothetical protein